jgi:peptide chain release factor 1
MLDKLKAIYDRYVHLEEQLSDPSVINDMDKFRKINKDYKDLQPIVDVYKKYDTLLDRQGQAKEMLDDHELRDMAWEELNEVNPQIAELDEEIKILLIPKDPEDSKDVLFEIRSNVPTFFRPSRL